MKRSEARLAIVVVTGVILLGACNIFRSADDKGITTNIQAKLFNDPVLKTRDIHVNSSNGIVTVSGAVGTELEKAAVERLAAQEQGVRNVVDLLSVTAQSAAPAPGGIETAETTPPPPPVTHHAAPHKNPAPAKPRHIHHTQAPNNSNKEDKARAELQAYTSSLAPAATANPTPAPSPAAPAPATAVPTPVAAPPASPPAPPPPAPKPVPKPQEHVTIPAGTVLTIRMIDNIDSGRNQAGEEFAATLDAPITVDDHVVAARGGDARVRLVEAQSAGHISGQSSLQLELVAVTMNGVSYPTKSGYYEQHGGSRGTRSAETIGGGAVLGALIGGILGHGRGAAIGSVAGAGAGTAVQVSTKGQQVKVPAETKLDFTLKDPVDVSVAGGA
ncbi:MAG: BON domain-containing protein [Limisphaerales bacterium]